MKRYIKKVLKIILKPGTKRFNLARKIAVLLGLVAHIPKDVHYHEWVERTEPFNWTPHQEMVYQPKISIIVPVFNPVQRDFLSMVYSVVNQTYVNWELILINASTDVRLRKHTSDATFIDQRIKVIELKSNKGIAENTNEGLASASGEYVALLDHDDILAQQALHEMVNAIQDNQKASLIYSDEDKLSADGLERFDPHFKPDWSPQLLEQLNYINHFSMIRSDILKKLKGFRSGFDGAQDFDLYLRVTDENDNVVHVPKILYHWRAAVTSTANDFDSKQNILEAGVRALEEHFKRKDVRVSIVKPIVKQPGFYEPIYARSDKQVAIVILPSLSKEQNKKLIEVFLDSINSDQANVTFYVPRQVEPLQPKAGKIFEYDTTSDKDTLEFIQKESSEDAIIIVNAGLVPQESNSIYGLANFILENRSVDFASPLVTEADKHHIVSAGYAAVDEQLISLFQGCHVNQHTYFGNSDWMRNIDVPALDCFAFVKEKLSFVKNSCSKSGELDVKELYKQIQKNSLRSCLFPFTRFSYHGSLGIEGLQTRYFNHNILTKRVEYSVSKFVNLPEVKND